MANEAVSGVSFVSEVLDQCSGFLKVDFFVVLDNASTDATREILDTYALVENQLHVIWAPGNRGVVDAYMRGYREALASEADWILEIDAGFSHLPQDIPKFFDAMCQGYDCVFGTRFAYGGKIRRSSLRRRFISRSGTILTNLALRSRLTDMTSGFQLFNRCTLQRVLEKGVLSRGPFFQTEIKAYCQSLRIAEVPITYSSASHDIGFRSVRDALRQLWRLRLLGRSGALFL